MSEQEILSKMDDLVDAEFLNRASTGERCMQLLGELSAYSEDVIYDALDAATRARCGESLVAAIRRIASEIEAEEREAAEEWRGEVIMEDGRGN